MSKRESLFRLVFLLVVNLLKFVNGRGQNTVHIDWDKIKLTTLHNVIPENNLIIAEVLENQPLSIVFENVGAPAQEILCRAIYDDHSGKISRSTLHRNLMMPVIRIPKMTVALSTRWTCVTRGPVLPQMASFETKVKGAKHLKVKINGSELSLTMANLTAPYDGSAVYQFECCAMLCINLVCSNVNNDSWTLGLHYYNMSGIKIIETRANISDEPVSFNMLMTADKDNSYIDCTTSKEAYKQSFTYRIIFKRRYAYDLIVSINNEELMPKVMSTGDIKIKYQHVFHSIDTVLLKCQKRNYERSGSLKFEYVRTVRGETNELNTYMNSDVQVVRMTPSERSLRILLNDKFLRKSRVLCYIQNSTISAEISFVSRTEADKAVHVDIPKQRTSTASYAGDDEDYLDDNFPNQTVTSTSAASNDNKPPIIVGLPQSDVLYQNSDNKTWKAVYIYRANQTVTLTCITEDDRKLQWLFGENENLKRISGTSNWVISDTFTFKAEHNGTSIVCEAKDKLNSSNTQRAVVILHQKINVAVVGNSAGGSNSNLIIGCIAGVIAAALSAGCVVFCCRRNKTAAPRKESRQRPPAQLSPTLLLRHRGSLQNTGDNGVHGDDTTTLERSRQELGSFPTYDYAVVPPSDECPCRHEGERQRRPSDSDELEDHYYSEIDEYFINKREAAKQRKNLN